MSYFLFDQASYYNDVQKNIRVIRLLRDIRGLFILIF